MLSAYSYNLLIILIRIRREGMEESKNSESPLVIEIPEKLFRTIPNRSYYTSGPSEEDKNLRLMITELDHQITDLDRMFNFYRYTIESSQDFSTENKHFVNVLNQDRINHVNYVMNIIENLQYELIYSKFNKKIYIEQTLKVYENILQTIEKPFKSFKDYMKFHNYYIRERRDLELLYYTKLRELDSIVARNIKREGKAPSPMNGELLYSSSYNWSKPPATIMNINDNLSNFTPHKPRPKSYASVAAGRPPIHPMSHPVQKPKGGARTCRRTKRRRTRHTRRHR